MRPATRAAIAAALAVAGAAWLASAQEKPPEPVRTEAVDPPRTVVRPLAVPHDIDLTLYVPGPRGGEKLVSIKRALAWGAETEGRHTVLRVRDEAGKAWYFPLDHVIWIEAVPVVG